MIQNTSEFEETKSQREPFTANKSDFQITNQDLEMGNINTNYE